MVLHLDPDLGKVNADLVQIEQVIMNLIVNARDAMPKGGRLTITTANIGLAADSEGFRPVMRAGPYVTISFTDTGLGMNEETQARLFEPFFTTKELGRGTGMGLSIIYGVVQQSGGNVSVQSELGQGSTFEVFLPRVVDLSHPVGRRSRPANDGGVAGTETILVVEDDDALRELVSSMLTTVGYRVLTAGSGVEALAIIDGGEHFELLLSDVVLRGSMDGPEIARQLKAKRPDLKVLFMSGYSEMFVAGPNDGGSNVELLEKPFSADGLRGRVRDILSRKS